MRWDSTRFTGVKYKIRSRWNALNLSSNIEIEKLCETVKISKDLSVIYA